MPVQAGSSHEDPTSVSGITLRLEVISGNASGHSITVDDELVIGRLADGDGRLEEDPELSRHHARITRERDGRYAIEDLGSSNGTFVNGLGLTSPAVLVVGDSIELGGTTLVVREITAPPTPETDAAPTETTAAPDLFRDATVFARALPEEDLDEGESELAAAQPTAGPQAVPAEARAEPAAATTDLPAPSAEALPPFDVRVSIDVQAREAELRVGEGGEPLRFVLDVDGWSFAGPAAS